MQRVRLTTVLLSLICLGYFYSFDGAIFKGIGFSPIFRFLLMFCDQQTAWLIFAICCLAVLWPRPGPLLALADKLSAQLLKVVLVCVVLIALGTIFVYRNHPFSMDEYSEVFQAKTFAAGHLRAQAAAPLIDWLIPPHFNGLFLAGSHVSGLIAETYWPGFSLLLAPFELIRAPWLCNALLAGVAIYLIHQITLELTGEARAAGWSVLFTLASSAFVANAISYYSMQAHLTANLLFAWLLIRPSRRRAMVAGVVGSVALVLHNPFPHILFALPWIFWFASSRSHRQYLLPLIVGYVPICLGVGVGWYLLRAGLMPSMPQAAGASSVAHGIFKWPDAILLNMRAAATVKMFVWASPCLFVLAAIGAWQRRQNSAVRLLTLSAALTFAGYMFVQFDQGHGWGYRYFHSAWGAMPVLAGCAMAGRSADKKYVAFVGAVSVLALTVLVPWQLWQINQLIGFYQKQLGSASRPGNNVFFVSAKPGDYLGDLVQFDPQLRSPDLVLASRGEGLDTELVRLNWPDAVRVQETSKVVQWNLGPSDVRTSSPDDTAPHFVIGHFPSGDEP